MAARGTIRRRHGGPRVEDNHTSEEKKVHHHPSTSGKKSTSSSSTSRSLNEILDTLKITYSNENGLLVGDLVAPSLSTLEILLKNLTKLSDQLEMISNQNGINLDLLTRIKERGSYDGPLIGKSEGNPELSLIDGDDHVNNIREDVVTEEKSLDFIESDNRSGKEELDIEPEIDLPAKPFSVLGSSKRIKDDMEYQPMTTQEEYSHSKHTPSEFIKNPKSEFVTSQSLPPAAHALGLFTDSNTLNSTGEVDLKLKYGVASYPSTDLKDKLPGAIPDIDFSKSKPPNQIQFATFQSFIENFFRNLTEEDLKFLKKTYVDGVNTNNDTTYDPVLDPFLTPKLGSLYTKVWNEEEQQENYTTTIKEPSSDQFKAKGSNERLNEDILESERFTLGPLVSRLLSAIVQETDIIDHSTNSYAEYDSENNDDKKQTTSLALLHQQQQPTRIPSVNLDFNTLEERLKSELKYIGLFNANPEDDDLHGENNNEADSNDDSTINNSICTNTDDKSSKRYNGEPNWTNVEDDEVSQELRLLQGNLKNLVVKNNKRKRALAPVIETHLSWQEYLSILDDLDKQVDQVYLKRIKVPKHKKKKGSHQIPPSLQAQINNQQQMVNSNIKSVLEKRQKWITKISPLFYKAKPPQLKDATCSKDGSDLISTEDKQVELDVLLLSDGGYMKRQPKESIFNSLDYDAIEDDDEEMDDENIVGKDKEKDDDLGL